MEFKRFRLEILQDKLRITVGTDEQNAEFMKRVRSV